MSSNSGSKGQQPIDRSEEADRFLAEALGRVEGLGQKRKQRWKLSAYVIVIDIVAIVTAYCVASLLYLQDLNLDLLARTLLSLIPIVLLLSIGSNGYSVEVIAERLRSAWRIGWALTFASLIMFLLFFFLKISDEFSRAVLAIGTVLSIFLLAVGRFAAASLAEQTFAGRPFANICIYDGDGLAPAVSDGAIKAEEIGLRPSPDDPAMLEKLGRLATGADSVIVHCAAERRAEWAFMLKSLDVATELVVPELTSLRPLDIRNRSGQTSLLLGSGQLSMSQRLIKRGFDLAVSVAILPFLAPILIIIALAIKLDSPGPALFRQDRIGLANRKFKILKFRTMRIDMQDDEARKTTSRTDPRVTRVGEFLRRTSLDELPQFLNVMLGDMSIVGPRPHAEMTAIGTTLLWEIDNSYWHRHVVQPGITGLAQVRGHRGSLFEEQHLRDRLNADLEYVSNWSLAGDVKIILRTANVLVHRNAF